MQKAKITGHIPLKIRITDHVIDESIQKRGLSLKNLPREECRKILEERLAKARVLRKNHPYYINLVRGMPKTSKKEQIIYKIDKELDYIYVVKREVSALREIMVSIYRISEIGGESLIKIRDLLE